MKKIDLHVHSSFSGDADFPVSTLIDMAEQENISVLSISDHNSSKSALEGVELCSKRNIGFITGIEIDVCFKKRNFHLLGYGYNVNSKDFDYIESDFIKLQKSATPVKIDKLRKLGFYIEESLLYKDLKGDIPQEESMAEIILEDHRNDKNALLLPYRKGGSRSDMPLINFFWDFFSSGKPCHVEINYPDLPGVVDIIRDNGGIPVIAHIGANVKNNHLQFIAEMTEAGVMGVEVISSYHEKGLCEELLNHCTQHALFATCGSDFHGKNKPNIQLGSCNYDRAAYKKISEFLDNVHIY